MENESGVIDVRKLFGEMETVQPAEMRQRFDRNRVKLVSQEEWDTLKLLKERAGHLVIENARLESDNRSLTEDLTKEKTSSKEKAANERARMTAAIKSISEASMYPVKNENEDVLSNQYLSWLQVHIKNVTKNSRLVSSRHSYPGSSTEPEREPQTETSSIGDAQPGSINQCLTAEPPASAAGNNVPGPSQSSQASLGFVKTEVSPRDDERGSELTSLQGATTGPPESALLPTSNDGVPLVASSSPKVPIVAPNPTGVNAPTRREDRPGIEIEPAENLGPPDGSRPYSANGTRTGHPSSGSGDEQAQTPPPPVSPSGSAGSMIEEIRGPSQEARRMRRKRKLKDDEHQAGSGAHMESPVELPNQSESTGNKFKCQELGCGETFLLLGHLNTHRLKVHRLEGVPGQNFGCRHCGRTFATRAERASHNYVKCTVER